MFVVNNSQLFDAFDKKEDLEKISDSDEIKNERSSENDKKRSPDQPAAEDKSARDRRKKRVRQAVLEQPKPIVADSFETEAEMEFKAAKIDADTGAAVQEGKSVVLAHQVRSFSLS